LTQETLWSKRRHSLHRELCSEGGVDMGLFISRTVNPQPIQEQLRNAYMAPQLPGDAAESRAADEAPAAAQSSAAGPIKFHAGRFLGALIIFGILLGVAIVAEANEWVEDTGRIYDLATTVLGVIVGFLGGEAAGGAPPTT
jgi:hypothetical protein